MRLQQIRAVSLTAMSVLLAACPAPYTRIDREVEATIAPDIYCLMEEFRDLTEQRFISYSAEDSKYGTRHNFTYYLSRTPYSWSFLMKPSGIISITHSSGVDDDHQRDLPVVREKMKEVEDIVRGRCGLGDVMDGAKETCHGKACSAA